MVVCERGLGQKWQYVGKGENVVLLYLVNYLCKFGCSEMISLDIGIINQSVIYVHLLFFFMIC